MGHCLQPSPVVAERGGYPVLCLPACLMALYRPRTELLGGHQLQAVAQGSRGESVPRSECSPGYTLMQDFLHHKSCIRA